MGEWIRFWITAVLLTISVVSFAAAVTGAWRFGFVMNRMHAAGIGDTLGLLALTVGLAVSSGTAMDVLKILLLVLFQWFSSPVSTHVLAQVEFATNPDSASHFEDRTNGGAFSSEDEGEKEDRTDGTD